MKYSSSYIQQYLQGKLSSTQMHEIEKEALNDPFLADVIEGMTKGLDHYEEDVELLKNKLFKKKSKKNTIIAWTAAASFIVLVTAAVFLFPPKSGNIKQTVAKKTVVQFEKEEQNNDKNILIDSAIADTPVNTSSAAASPEAIHKKEERSRSTTMTTKELTDARPLPLPSSVINKEDVQEKTVETKNENKSTTASENSHAPENQSVQPHTESVEKKLNARANKSIKADNNKEYEIALQDSVVFDEIVVNGYSSETKKNTKKSKESTLDFRTGARPVYAKPITGWNNYEKYIKQNKRIDNTDALIHGTVILSVFIDQDGDMSNFIIEKSLSPFYDKEAIRLIKDGPKWKSRKKGSEKITVYLEF